MEFVPFPKIARLKRECLITEKLDGTNAQIHIVATDSRGYLDLDTDNIIASRQLIDGTKEFMFAGSRTRWITPTSDNYGFAKWVLEHSYELWPLGPGAHFGEWWGLGIQRNYGLTEKRFSLFNAWRWNEQNPLRPACCDVVPALYSGPFNTTATEEALYSLRTVGSVAAPGFMKPEGIIIFLSAARTYFKQTLEKDEEPKGRTVAAAPPETYVPKTCVPFDHSLYKC